MQQWEVSRVRRARRKPTFQREIHAQHRGNATFESLYQERRSWYKGAARWQPPEHKQRSDTLSAARCRRAAARLV
jgi:shikimate kinase